MAPREVYELGCIVISALRVLCGACLTVLEELPSTSARDWCHDHLRREFGNYPRSQRDGEDEGETDAAFAGLI
jgi:hypothetical protein